MRYSDELFLAFISCKYKAYLIKNRNAKIISDYQKVYSRQKYIQLKRFETKLKERNVLKSEFVRGKTTKGFVLNTKFSKNNIEIEPDGVEIISKYNVVPIYITPHEKITSVDKLFVSAQGLLLKSEFKLQVDYCRIVFGEELKQSKIKLLTYLSKAKEELNVMNEMLSNAETPILMKNKHCSVCAYYEDCNEILVEKNDLSLITALKPAEIIKKNSKGIFTVLQLSYLFRPTKRVYQKRKFIPELKALAIREMKTYIFDMPKVKQSDVKIFIDFEGIPDRNFVYLIGVLILNNDTEETYSFWADSDDEESIIFKELFNLLKQFEEYIIYHYGQYEIRVLRRLIAKTPEFEEYIEYIIDNSFNILSLFTNYIYPPTYTNGLKEIARHLNFNWSEKNVSGIQSLMWRYQWELSSDNSVFKRKLIQYNIEDCHALAKVFNWIISIPSDVSEVFKQVKEIKPENNKKWCKTDYQLDDFEKINSVAYFNYQRKKIYLRTNKQIKKAVQRVTKKEKKNLKVDRQINMYYEVCPNCGGSSIETKSTHKGIVVDLVFIKNGIKRCIKEVQGGHQVCNTCNKKLMRVNFNKLQGYGKDLVAWTVDQYISYRIGLTNVANVLRETFNIDIGVCIYEFKEKLAEKYKPTYNEIKQSLISGQIIHADETDVKVRGFSSPYIWVFSSMDTVLYYFTTNRDAAFLKEFLENFSGILISDFYAGYDSLECEQQKCLIHLIRDLNNDLLKNPFDEEFQQFVQLFGELLRGIIDTIDKYGLSIKHYGKHKTKVNGFFIKINRSNYKTDLCKKYIKRFNKNRSKLFTFLSHNNVPWNNNNAEHAIKAFAKYRRLNNGLFTSRSVCDYVILLSIQQTCVYRGLSFLDFLRSEEISLNKYTEKEYKKRIKR